MPDKQYSSNSYRYGFNGKENDNEVKGVGNWQDYGMRMYDPRLGRFPSVDPITKGYPELTPYQFASNTPIWAIDIDGLESWVATRKWSAEDRELFGEFVKAEIKKIEAKAIEGQVDSYTCYDCADLAVSLYIRYAAENGLEIEFTDSWNGVKMNSSDQNLLDSYGKPIEYDPANPEKSRNQYEELVRRRTSAQSIRGDMEKITRNSADLGDIINSGFHVTVLLGKEKEVIDGIMAYPTISGTIDNNNPLNGVLLLGRQGDVSFGSDANQMFYRFKELENFEMQMMPVNISPVPVKSSIPETPN